LKRGKAIVHLSSFGIFPIEMHSLKIFVRKGAKTPALFFITETGTSVIPQEEQLSSDLIASITFSSVNFSNENNEVFKRPFYLYSRNFSLIKSFDSSKVIFESPLILEKNSLKALATSTGSETGDLLMGSSGDFVDQIHD
jgi:hypothetical protein